MNTLKHKNMMASYTGHNGHVTVGAVTDQIPAELFARLTGHELGLVMSAVNTAYHNGRASHGGFDITDDCLWSPVTGDGGALIPLEALRAITITETTERVPHEPTMHDPSTSSRWTTKHYSLDYKERY